MALCQIALVGQTVKENYQQITGRTAKRNNPESFILVKMSRFSNCLLAIAIDLGDKMHTLR